MSKFWRDPGGFYRSTALDELPWLVHGFGTRQGSVDGSPVTLTQIHSDRVVRAEAAAAVCEGDALITDVPGQMIAVKTADCVPILIADTVRHVLAAVHAGWRGTLQDIVGKTIRVLEWEYGSSPRDLMAAIGPSIGGCCYEVGPEVSGAFAEIFPERKDMGEHTRIDLREANRRLLVSAGVSENSVSVSKICTACAGDEFYSYRREGSAAGRMFSGIGIRKEHTQERREPE